MATINVIAYINKLIPQFPFEIFAPTIVDVITDGNLTSVAIKINLNGFIGKSPPIYTNKSFGVPGRKNSMHNIISKFVGFFSSLLCIILSTFSFLKKLYKYLCPNFLTVKKIIVVVINTDAVINKHPPQAP